MPSIITASTASNTALNFSADTSGVLEIRTGSSPTTAMTIDGSQNVGIGTSSPTALLHVNGTTNISSSHWLTFGGANTLFSSASLGLLIQTPSGNENTIFRNSSGTERMRIDSSGNVGIGTSSPGLRLDVSASQPTRGVIAILTNSFSATKTGSQMVFSQAGLDNWAIGMPGGSSSAFVLWNGRSSSGDGTEFLRVNDVGNLVLRGGTATASGVGVTFPATQSASSDANTLDDYEEGTFTPTITATGGAFASVTYVNQNGRYTKIGDTVFFTLRVTWSAASGGSGDVRIGGLPFSAGDAYTSLTPFTYINVVANNDFQMRTDTSTQLAPQTLNGSSGLDASVFRTGTFNKSIAVAGCYKV